MDDSLELKLSLAVCLGMSGVYVVYALLAEPSGGHPFGNWLGIIGALMMVSTEILYSLRKRTRLFRQWGPVRYWLSAHIFTGIVGPFLVLMHSAFEFRGLAGIAMGLTVIVVGSGFLGRYLYNAIPRSLAGVETSAADLALAVNKVQEDLAAFLRERPSAVRDLVEADARRVRRARGAWALVILRGWDEWLYRRGLRRQIKLLEKETGARLREVEWLLVRRRSLERQIRMMQSARRLMSAWHIAHVPMGVALFSSVAIHVAAEFYFRAGVFR